MFTSLYEQTLNIFILNYYIFIITLIYILFYFI